MIVNRNLIALVIAHALRSNPTSTELMMRIAKRGNLTPPEILARLSFDYADAFIKESKK